MKVKVLQDKCIGCGACVAIAGENFDFDENGLSTVINGEVTEKTIEAKEACPVYAIEIEESKDAINEVTEKTTTCECEKCECGKDCDCNNEEEELEEAA